MRDIGIDLGTANIFNVSVDDVYNDLNVKLPIIDTILYNRVNKVLKKINSS